jgi:hypothetical protein
MAEARILELRMVVRPEDAGKIIRLMQELGVEWNAGAYIVEAFDEDRRKVNMLELIKDVAPGPLTQAHQELINKIVANAGQVTE